jgi:hypothetical protein
MGHGGIKENMTLEYGGGRSPGFGRAKSEDDPKNTRGIRQDAV